MKFDNNRRLVNIGYIQGQIHSARETLTKCRTQWQSIELGLASNLEDMVKSLDQMGKKLDEVINEKAN